MTTTTKRYLLPKGLRQWSHSFPFAVIVCVIIASPVLFILGHGQYQEPIAENNSVLASAGASVTTAVKHPGMADMDFRNMTSGSYIYRSSPTNMPSVDFNITRSGDEITFLPLTQDIDLSYLHNKDTGYAEYILSQDEEIVLIITEHKYYGYPLRQAYRDHFNSHTLTRIKVSKSMIIWLPILQAIPYIALYTVLISTLGFDNPRACQYKSRVVYFVTPIPQQYLRMPFWSSLILLDAIGIILYVWWNAYCIPPQYYVAILTMAILNLVAAALSAAFMRFCAHTKASLLELLRDRIIAACIDLKVQGLIDDSHPAPNSTADGEPIRVAAPTEESATGPPSNLTEWKKWANECSMKTTTELSSEREILNYFRGAVLSQNVTLRGDKNNIPEKNNYMVEVVRELDDNYFDGIIY